MNGPRNWLGLFLATALIESLGSDAPTRGEDALPKYRLKVGQELIYRGGGSFQYQNGSLDSEDVIHAWVIRQNADGSWRVVLAVRSRMTQRRTPKVADAKLAAAAVAGKVQEVVNAAARPEADDEDMTDAQLGTLDLFADGRMRLDESITQSYRPTDPEKVFPLLPANSAQAKQGWLSTRTGMLEGRNDYRMADQAGVIVAEQHTPFDKIYLESSTSRFTFDPARGVVDRVDTSNTQGYGFRGTGNGELILGRVIDHDGDWAEAMARDADIYFAAHKFNHQSPELINQGEGRIAPLLTNATEMLKAAREKMTVPAFAKALDAEIKQQEGMGKYYAERAETRRQVIGQEAADWELKDLAGATHTMREFRGRVVILDFWYRGCAWCIRAMPQMKQLADDFHDQPVTFLGMNKDQETEDARFVADEMGLNYLTLVGATSEPEKYHVQGFPTLVVIDPQGKIAEFHVGYSATLREEIGAVIRRLLPPDAKAALKAN